MRILYLYALLVLWSGAVIAQKVTYTDLERDDYKSTEFEIIGKVSGNIMVYKSDRGDYAISIYDNALQLKNRVKLDFLPKKLISVDFINYADKVFMIYQFQRKDAVYSFCATMDGGANFTGAPIMVDSTRIGFYTKENKVYSVEYSEDKNRIMVYKINQDKENDNVFYTFLYDSSFQLINNARVSLPMENKRIFLSNFNLTNEGDLLFNKLERTSNRDYIVSGSLIVKRAVVDSFSTVPMVLKTQLLDEVKMKVDNNNKNVLVTAFYYKQKRGNVEGLYVSKYDYVKSQQLFEKEVVFTPELKGNAKGDASTSAAFNDYFIRKLINTKDGGFLVTAESYYTTSRTQPWNRWNYMYGPYGMYTPYYYSPYSPFYYNPWYNNYNSQDRYHYDNVAVLSLDNEGNLLWSNFVHKSQYDDGSDLYLSYMMVNIGSELRFLYNELDRRSFMITDNSVQPDGKSSRKPTLRNLDKGFTWMPRYGKQISSRSVLIPCINRNYICFAKIDF
ncbi:hypothetical protein [Chitinophaga pinensis]|uniref:Uncharacterized protein n=1 Tax=Chitinophaga pinensis (strain ATCC 43595 / DSM 2588 / LMG 13176 / NBRC 15968 / NCIMB 11800 / UQM 2034) TaxID=485918 RepID=A0A979GUD6_CHIPD|nr:hypothetical protein [Chitinophaga pinensis]ACU64447.1 hypothetical protein Cpin_7046 [Chitinophaga pinensis DSM 2588]